MDPLDPQHLINILTFLFPIADKIAAIDFLIRIKASFKQVNIKILVRNTHRQIKLIGAIS